MYSTLLLIVVGKKGELKLIMEKKVRKRSIKTKIMATSIIGVLCVTFFTGIVMIHGVHTLTHSLAERL